MFAPVSVTCHINAMDFPMFFLDGIGNRMLIAVVASLHNFINHPFAVGAYPLVALMEWWGWRTGRAEWDRLAYRVTFVLFVITTTVGALTGVGIWFTTALIAPFGIGSLLRVFFWAWFFEWLVFVIEVGLVLIYFLTWKRWSEGAIKKLHIGVGAVLAAFSWCTMAIIAAVLAFMMEPGSWKGQLDIFTAFFNPLYFPQLLFRTSFAMAAAGLFLWFLLFFFTERGSRFRHAATRFAAAWVLAWAAPFAAGSLWYWKAVPDTMLANISVAMATQRFVEWHETLAVVMAAAIGAVILTALIGVLRPRIVPGVALLVPFIIGLWLLGHFERVREFVRKPYVIGDYLYSNGVKVNELPVFQRDGILTHATYVENRTVTTANMEDAGKDVFLLSCAWCHTTTGINGVVAQFERLYGSGEWSDEAMTAFIHSMHNSRTFMPPFPGNDKEAEALVAYVKKLRGNPSFIIDAHGRWTPKESTQNLIQERRRMKQR